MIVLLDSTGHKKHSRNLRAPIGVLWSCFGRTRSLFSHHLFVLISISSPRTILLSLLHPLTSESLPHLSPLDPTPPITPPQHHLMPPQRILTSLHKMILVWKIQKFTLNAPPLTHIKRRQTLCNRTSIVLVRMDEKHGRCPVGSVA